jgi:hypothetical protein
MRGLRRSQRAERSDGERTLRSRRTVKLVRATAKDSESEGHRPQGEIDEVQVI